MFSLEEVHSKMIETADEASKNKEYLTELDGLSGDGDLGTTVDKIAAQIRDTDISETGSMGEYFKTLALSINRTAPSTFGTLISSGLLNVAKASADLETFSESDVIKMIQAFKDGIMKRGKAKQGDKTMLDALIPFAETLDDEYKKTEDLAGSLRKASQAAKDGAESTKGMAAKTGRASWISERTQDNIDGGAVLCAKITELLLK